MHHQVVLVGIICGTAQLQIVHVADPHDWHIGDADGEAVHIGDKELVKMLLQEPLRMRRVEGLMLHQALHRNKSALLHIDHQDLERPR